jgi:putative peptide zinc metalloprotease protein
LNTVPELPRFRSDVEILAQAAPGKPNRHVLKDPRSGLVVEMSDKEIFLCRQMDGATSLPAVQSRFLDRYGMGVRIEHLEAFVAQLGEQGFLEDVRARAGDNLWKRMRPVPFLSDRIFAALGDAFGWCFGKVGGAVFWLFAAMAAVIVVLNGEIILHNLGNFFEAIRVVGETSGASLDLALRVMVVLVVMPFLAEMAKAVACRHAGARVPEVRVTLYMRFIPRVASDVSALARIEGKADRLRVARAGMMFQLFLFALATVVYEMLTVSNPARDLALTVAIGAAVSLLINALPLAEGDGSLWLAVRREQQDLRARAVRVFRAWLLRATPPEALSARDRRFFIGYGMLADAWSMAINGALFWLVGYWLVQWMGGLGAALFVALVALRFEDDIKRFWMTSAAAGGVDAILPKDPSKRRTTVWVVTIVILVVLFLIPYPVERSGEFRVQPDARRELRADIESQIAVIEVEEGAWVKAGDVLVRLDDRIIKNDLSQAEAALAAEQEELKLLELGARQEQVAKAEQTVKVAETAYVHSEAAYQRAAELHEKGHVSDQDYENALKQRDIDRESLELARRELDLVKSGSRPEQIQAQKEIVRGLQAQVDRLKGDLDRTVIASPLEGMVTTLYLAGKIGQRVVPGDVIAIVEDNRKVEVRVALPEPYAGEVKIGARVRAKPWAFSSRIFEGEVTAIKPSVLDKTEDILKQDTIEQEKGSMRSLNMPGDNVVLVMAEIDNPDQLLRTDMTGMAKIRAGTKPLGWALLSPVLRFFTVRVWSWIP